MSKPLLVSRDPGRVDRRFPVAGPVFPRASRLERETGLTVGVATEGGKRARGMHEQIAHDRERKFLGSTCTYDA